MKKLSLISSGAVLLAVMALLLVGTALAIADYNLEVADRYGFSEATLADGAIVQYIGDLNTTYGPSGSGVFDSFVRLQGGDTVPQKGYNTDGVREWDTKAGAFTHSIKLSQIPTVMIGGQLYWEFWADINDSDSTPLISLDDFELYLTSNPSLTGYPFGANASLLYDYEAANAGAFILINDVNQGSGRGDLRYLVPQGSFDPGNCNYGNPACTTYLVLYSEWGAKGGTYLFDGGFEEWKVKKYPVLQVSKTILGSYNTPVSWTITKDFDASYALFTGESKVHNFRVAVDPIFGAPVDTKVYGTITIVGDPKDAVNATITDKFNGLSATITGCSVPVNGDGTYTIASKATVTCSYQLNLAGGPVAGTNTATASYTMAGGVFLAFQGKASILAAAYVNSYTGYPTIHVTDTNGGAWTTSLAPAVWTYTQTFACNADEGSHVNTASITETGQSDTATVVVTCYAPSVTKTADESYTRTFEWEITKSVTPANWALFSGESGTSDYTIILNQIGFHDNDWRVSGTITIANPHPTRVAELTQVIDDAGGILAGVNCPSLDVPAGGSLVCSYDTLAQDSVDNNPFGALNTATATQKIYNFSATGIPSSAGTRDYSGTHAIDFSQAAVALVDESVSVSDSVEGDLGSFSGDQTFNYSRTFACDADEGLHENIATFVTNDTLTTGSSSATVNVSCYDLAVSKTADEFYTRSYTWSIDKVVDNPGPITVSPGGSVDLNYIVTVGLLSYLENDWQVTGDIVVTNSHPSRSADLTQVLDNAGGLNAAVSCPAYVVPAGGSLTCTYDSGVKNNPNANPFGSLNTATATQQLYTFASDGSSSLDGTQDYQGTAPINFAEATVSLVDESIDVNDSFYGFLGTVTVGVDTLPKSFSYTRTITVDVFFCGSFNVDNLAGFITNDTSSTGQDSVTVVIQVPCSGCTPGFWQGGAGSQLWNEVNDPQWVYGGTNPYIHTTLFNSFFSLHTDIRLDGKTMMDLVGTGGGDDPAVKAARDMVAAYLNESAFPSAYPVADIATLLQMWYDAVLAGDPGFDAFHATVSAWNSPPAPGYCPLP